MIRGLFVASCILLSVQLINCHELSDTFGACGEEYPTDYPSYKKYFCNKRSIFLNPEICNGNGTNESIDVHETEITQLPNFIFNGLENSVKKLSLSYNKIKSYDSNVFTNLTKLVELDISFNQLNQLQNNSFKGLKNLERLFLRSNKLSSLDDDIFDDLINLNDLTLENNCLQNLSPNIFNNLKNLGFLSLQLNFLKNLNSNIFNNSVNLRSLNLESNLLETLSNDTFKNLNSLEKLNLRSNQITSLPSGVFFSLKNLKYLDLSHNKLTSLPDMIFVRLGKVTTIDVSNNYLTSIASKTFYITRFPYLQNLKIENNAIDYIEHDAFEMLWMMKLLNLKGNCENIIYDPVIDRPIVRDVFSQLEVTYPNGTEILYF